MNRVLAIALLAGWIADALAAPDSDVEKGVELYEDGSFEDALTRFEAAIVRRGPLPGDRLQGRGAVGRRLDLVADVLEQPGQRQPAPQAPRLDALSLDPL